MFLQVIVFVAPLGLDTLALAIALGLRGFRPWRPALVFSLFETIMPVFGFAVARVVSLRFQNAAVLLGGALLMGIGVRAIRQAFRGEEASGHLSFGSARCWLLAGVAVSTDELAAGFPLGASGLPIGITLIAIFVQTMIVTLLGISLGNRARAALARRASRYAGIAAGIVFAAIGLWLVAGRFPSLLHLPS